MNKFAFAANAALITFVISTAFAYAAADAEIETITVSATPIALDDAGSSVTVITREEIERRNTSIQSLLRSVPGFAVSQQGSVGTVTQIRVRGAEANQVLVMINGIEANDLAQGSEFDFSQITTNDIERIEIVRGPQSALWGSDALAGVVHIITTPESKETSFSGFLEAGSFSTIRGTLTSTLSSEAHSAKLSADYLDTDGTNISRDGSEDDGMDNLTLSLSGRSALSENLKLTYTARQTRRTTDFDGVDFFSTGLPVDADNRSESDYLYSGISITHLINDALDHSLNYYRTDTNNKTKPSGDEQEGLRQQLRYQFNLSSNLQRLSVRAESESEDFKQRGTASFFGDPNQNRDTETTSVAAEYRLHLDNLHLSLSGRQENNSDFDDSSSWRATANYQFPSLTLFASFGQSVKNPTFTERFGFFTNFIGNPDLEPEESTQLEVGLRGSYLNDRLEVNFTWFDADLENEINGFVFDPATFGFTAANIDGDSNREGAEVTIDFMATERLGLRANYSYLDATQDDFAGNPVTEVRRAEHSGSLELDYRFERGSVNLSVMRTGSQEDDYFPPFPPFQERVTLSGFTLVELSALFRLNESVMLTARVENALDEDYEQVFGYESPGAAAYLGIRVSW